MTRFLACWGNWMLSVNWELRCKRLVIVASSTGIRYNQTAILIRLFKYGIAGNFLPFPLPALMGDIFIPWIFYPVSISYSLWQSLSHRLILLRCKGTCSWVGRNFCPVKFSAVQYLVLIYLLPLLFSDFFRRWWFLSTSAMSMTTQQRHTDCMWVPITHTLCRNCQACFVCICNICALYLLDSYMYVNVLVY